MNNNLGISKIIILIVLLITAVSGFYFYQFSQTDELSTNQDFQVSENIQDQPIEKLPDIAETIQQTVPPKKPSFNFNVLPKATNVENGFIGKIDYLPVLGGYENEVNNQVSYLVLVPSESKELKEQNFKLILKEKYHRNGFNYNNDYVYYITNWRGINRISLKNFQIEELVKNSETDIKNFKINKDLIYYIDNGKLYSLNLNGKNRKLLTNLPKGINEIMYISDNKIIMQEVNFPVAYIEAGGVVLNYIKYDLGNKKITEIKSEELDTNLAYPTNTNILKLDSGRVVEVPTNSTEYNKNPFANYETEVNESRNRVLFRFNYLFAR